MLGLGLGLGQMLELGFRDLTRVNVVQSVASIMHNVSMKKLLREVSHMSVTA